jgi:hypothetical protein
MRIRHLARGRGRCLLILTVFVLVLGRGRLLLADFGPAVAISDAGQDARWPEVAFDKKGNALAVWERFDGANYRVQAAFRPRDGGFEPTVTISSPGHETGDPAVAVDKKGTALVVWRNNDGSNRIAAALRPRGEAFGAPFFLSGSGGYGPAVAFDGKGNALAAWGIHLNQLEAAFRPRNGIFEAPVTVSAADSANAPQVAFDKKGNSLLVWDAPVGATHHIEAAYRPNEGGFEPPVDVSGAGAGSGAHRFAFDKKGNAVVVWQEGAPPQVHAAIRDRNLGFGGGVLISVAGQPTQAPQIAIDKKGNAFAVWYGHNGTVYTVQAATRPRDGSFAAPVTLSDAGQNATDPNVAFDAKANALVVWRRFDGSAYRIQAIFGTP